MPKDSTIDLHNIDKDIYLGELLEQTFKPDPKSYEISYFGGEPTWLREPKPQLLACRDCQNPLTFLGQMYCPFAAQHCYHRVLYFLFCDKCLREFRCIRQQAGSQYAPTQIMKTKVKAVGEARELDSSPFGKGQFVKMVNRLKAQIEEEQAIEEADSEEEEDIMNEVSPQLAEQLNKLEQPDEDKKELLEMAKNEPRPEQKDIPFQVYKKCIVELGNPCVLYTDTPLPYNRTVLNPQHFCPKCHSKLTLEAQITQRMLTLSTDPNSKLLLMDWGSLMVYTCGGSCQDGDEECVVVQYEVDAIKEEDIKKLKKKNKNRKKKEKKSKSKEKDNNQKQESETEEKQPEGEGKVEEGDWD